MNLYLHMTHESESELFTCHATQESEIELFFVITAAILKQFIHLRNPPPRKGKVNSTYIFSYDFHVTCESESELSLVRTAI